MQILNEMKLDFDDVLLVPQRSPNGSRSDVELTRTFRFFHSNKEWHGFPIMAANMDTTGTFAMANALSRHEAVTCLHKHYSADQINRYFSDYNTENNVWISIGMNKREVQRLYRIASKLHHSPNICIDIANGYAERFVEWCAEVREEFSDSIIMAGNVCTPEMVSELILHGGVDIVKIGIGPGSACTTRLKTGCGFPQLSAIIECSHAAHGLKSGERRLGLICADGGCRMPGDICKAFAANADFVMLGGMLAGTDECEGEWEYAVDENFVEYKSRFGFYGMSSEKAQKKHNGGMREYATSEGRIKWVRYQGPADSVINDIKGGLRSCCAYVGATSLKDLAKCSKAVRVNRVHYDRSL